MHQPPITLRSTKSYHKLPCAHRQWFDSNPDGSAGPCAKLHGYDRSVSFEFAGAPDEHGWLVGFGDLKRVKSFLEYYFDHTALVAADDPDLDALMHADEQGLIDLRILPYGVSMEMSSLFIWEQVNPFIAAVTNRRCYVSKVESREHDGNSAFFEITDPEVAYAQSWGLSESDYLVQKAAWKFESPIQAHARINRLGWSYGPITPQATRGAC